MKTTQKQARKKLSSHKLVTVRSMESKLQKKQARKKLPLSKLVTIPPKAYPSTNIEHDSISILNNYLLSASTVQIIERFCAGLSGAKSGRMLSITGPYGSGKSTMATFLSGLVSEKTNKEWKRTYKILKTESAVTANTLLQAREKSNIHKKGLIRCMVTARREPITASILRALDSGASMYFGKYGKKNFTKAPELRRNIQELKNSNLPSTKNIIEIIQSMCDSAPIIIIIDEFGKNIEYFTTSEEQQSDLFLLQELAEMSGSSRKIPLSIVTLQHMAFEEYATGASTVQKQEWAKIQGRFEDIPFANSPDQTRQLVFNTIKKTRNDADLSHVNVWAKKEAKQMQNLGIESGFDSNVITACYPLGPLALEILPELCSRYGQHERTLLSFISDAGKHTVATFIDENTWNKDSLPVIGIDVLYDYFISGTSMIHSSSAHITRLMEIETIIRDSHGLNDLELKILKTIGVLNLVGRTGYLRASKKILNHAVSINTQQILKKLEEKSIITYRKYADEYRLWHGTDIDIAVKLDTYKNRYQKSSLIDMLYSVMSLEPVVAAKHSIETGTMRLFERRFIDKNSSEIILDESSDGVVVYAVDNTVEFQCEKPVIVVIPHDTSDLRRAVIDAVTIKDILDNDQDVKSDWVVRSELEERLADAEIILDRVFDVTYGDKAKWLYKGNQKHDTPSAIVSQICDLTYSQTPRIYNEMINRTVISSQATAARRRLLENMIAYREKPKFGIEGHGPDRAIYEAVFSKNGIHVISSKNKTSVVDAEPEWCLTNPPSNNTVTGVWNAMINEIKNSNKRVLLSDVYHICKLPPFGIKDGLAPIFATAVLLVCKNNIALYEHGTYVPNLIITTVERMIKNPDHFEVKYFKSTSSKKELLSTVISDFNINSKGSVLDVVSHLVLIVSALFPHIKQTKRLGKDPLAVRDTVLSAVEPDTLLFESLPKALGFSTKMSHSDVKKFSKILVKSKTTLQQAHLKTIDHLKKLLFDATGIHDRKKLSDTASIMLKGVTDKNMKLFLTAVSTDQLERDEDWINYVALSITDVPIITWKDDQMELFENNLREMSYKFKRLTSLYFTGVSDNFVKPSYQVIVTHADGTEHHNVVSLRSEQKKKLMDIKKIILKEMKKKGFTAKDTDALVAMLSEKHD